MYEQQAEPSLQLRLRLKQSIVAVVQLLSCVGLFATPWTAARQAPVSSTISRSLLTFMSFELVMPPNHFILCCHKDSRCCRKKKFMLLMI